MVRQMCHWPGCSRAAEGYYCEGHKAQAEARKKETRLFAGTRRAASAEWHGLYNTARWKRMRKEFLQAHPFCERCGQPATIADHITPHRGDAALFYSEANLQALCQACHSRKTLEENGFFQGGKQR